MNPTLRNPTGAVLTQDQREKSNRTAYWMHAIQFGLQYYVSGRFAAASGFTPVMANILHHGVELLLKACLAKDDSLDEIMMYGRRENYGHNLLLLWGEFQRRNPRLATGEFDSTISALHDFEHIRYPEALIREGATIRTNLFEVDVAPTEFTVDRNRQYVMNLPQIDRLMKVLFEAAEGNPDVFLREVNGESARRYYSRIERTQFGVVTDDAAPAVQGKFWLQRCKVRCTLICIRLWTRLRGT